LLALLTLLALVLLVLLALLALLSLLTLLRVLQPLLQRIESLNRLTSLIQGVLQFLLFRIVCRRRSLADLLLDVIQRIGDEALLLSGVTVVGILRRSVLQSQPPLFHTVLQTLALNRVRSSARLAGGVAILLAVVTQRLELIGQRLQFGGNAFLLLVDFLSPASRIRLSSRIASQLLRFIGDFVLFVLQLLRFLL